MERHPGRLIEQLQNVQTRQRRVIQQLQAENARRLADLTDVRLERDTFRKEAARVRKENVELQNRLEEVLVEYQDLKRERATLARSLVTGGHTHGRGAHASFKILSVLEEEQSESPPMTETTSSSTEQVVCPEIEPYSHRGLPDLPKSESPLLDHSAYNAVAFYNDSSIPMIQNTLCRDDARSASTL